MPSVRLVALVLRVAGSFRGPFRPRSRFQVGVADPSQTLIIARPDIAWHLLSLMGPPRFKPGTKGL
jgi:hypothetical protein